MAVPPPPPPPPRAPRSPERSPDRPRPPGRAAGARPDPKWSRWGIWAIGLVIVGLLALSLFTPKSSRIDLSYPDFVTKVQAGEVTKVRVNNDTSRITGELKDGLDYGGNQRDRGARGL